MARPSTRDQILQALLEKVEKEVGPFGTEQAAKEFVENSRIYECTGFSEEELIRRISLARSDGEYAVNLWLAKLLRPFLTGPRKSVPKKVKDALLAAEHNVVVRPGRNIVKGVVVQVKPEIISALVTEGLLKQEYGREEYRLTLYGGVRVDELGLSSRSRQ